VEELRSELLRVKSGSAEKERRLRARCDQYHRRFSDAQVSLAAAKENIARCEENIRRLEAELVDAHEQHASIRNHLQLRDSREPKEIVNDFRALKRSIGYLCTDLSAAITDRIHTFLPNLQFSSQAFHLKRLSRILSIPYNLIVSSARKGRPIEDFIDYSLRFLLNKMLCQELFDRCHPHIATASVERALAPLYEQVRLHEPQTISAKWRSTSFVAIDRILGVDATNISWAQEFVKRFEKEAVEPLAISICGQWSRRFFTSKHREETFNISQKAYLWHREVQANILALDFKPQLFDGGQNFDQETMLLLKHRQVTPSKSEPIIVSVGLGLISDRSFGEGKAREQAWQEKVDVLMEECFND